MPMPGLAGSDHRALQNVEGSKQSGRSVPLIIVRLSCWQAGSQRKNRLRAIQRLNLAFLIHAEHDRLVRWIYIEPHNVAHFSRKFRVGAEFEGLHAMRLQFVLLPTPLHGRGADFLTRRPGPASTMRGSCL